MRWLWTILPLAAMALIAVSAVEAAPPGNSRSGGNSKADNTSGKRNPTTDYHVKHGKKLSDGKYYYPGRDHHHWTARFYWGKYRSTFYYCPSTSCWYYWSGPGDGYYPLSYLSTEPPTPDADAPPQPETDSLPSIGPDGKPLKR